MLIAFKIHLDMEDQECIVYLSGLLREFFSEFISGETVILQETDENENVFLEDFTNGKFIPCTKEMIFLKINNL